MSIIGMRLEVLSVNKALFYDLIHFIQFLIPVVCDSHQQSVVSELKLSLKSFETSLCQCEV